MDNTDTITDFVKQLDQLECLAYELMRIQENSYTSPHNKMWRHIADALAIAIELSPQDLDNK